VYVVSDSVNSPTPTGPDQPATQNREQHASPQWPPEQPGRAPRQAETGPLVPETPILSKQTHAAPLSYIGSTRRIAVLIKRVGAVSPLAAGLAWLAGLIVILLAWVFVTVWYLIILLQFGVLLFPYRLIRRSHRKQEQLQKAELATMQAMMINQQRALNDDPNDKGPPR